jgi:hypothetical protein
VLLGLEPDVPAGVVAVDPAVPTAMLPMKVDQLHVGDSTLELLVKAGSWRAHGGPPGITTVGGVNRSGRG